MRIVVLGCVLAGCGRLGFDAISRGDAAAPDVLAVDAAPACGTGAASGPITLTGTTFRYYNVAAGPTRIRAGGAGLTFQDLVVEANGGDLNTLVILHASE